MTPKDFLKCYQKAKVQELNHQLLFNEYLRNKLEYFMLFFFGDYCKYPFNTFHKSFFDSYDPDLKGIKEIIIAPRNYAKSVIVALMMPLHAACFGTSAYILICSNTEQQTLQKIKDLRDELQFNKLLHDFFEIKFETARPAKSSFTVTINGKKVLIQGISRNSQLRGIRSNASRPDLIILDDIESSLEVLQEELRSKTLNWFFSDVLKLGTEGQYNIYVIGTVLHSQSLLKTLEKNPGFKTSAYAAFMKWPDSLELWEGEFRNIFSNLDNPSRESDAKQFYLENKEAMDKGSELLWPEKEDITSLYSQLIIMGRHSFFAELQNAPLSLGDRIFERFHYYDLIEDELCLKNGVSFNFREVRKYSYCSVDPSTGKARKGILSDYTAIVSGFSFKGRLFIHSVVLKRIPPTKIIKHILELNDEFNFLKISIEKNLFQGMLIDSLQQEAIKHETPLYIVPVNQTEKKESRIMALESPISLGKIVFNRAIGTEIMNTLEDFPHGHDDFPDALQQLWELTQNNQYKDNQFFKKEWL